MAKRVLEHTARVPVPWANATAGEAWLYLSDAAAAMVADGAAAQQAWTPRERDSIQPQAIWAARLMGNAEAEQRLGSAGAN